MTKRLADGDEQATEQFVGESPWNRADLAAVIAAYILIVFVLCPGNPLIGFPVHHDDFSNLASDLDGRA